MSRPHGPRLVNRDLLDSFTASLSVDRRTSFGLTCDMTFEDARERLCDIILNGYAREPGAFRMRNIRAQISKRSMAAAFVNLFGSGNGTDIPLRVEGEGKVSKSEAEASSKCEDVCL